MPRTPRARALVPGSAYTAEIAEAHRRTIASARAMTTEQFVQSLRDARVSDAVIRRLTGAAPARRPSARMTRARVRR